MSSDSKPGKKGYLLSLEAILCLTILLISINSFKEDRKTDLDREIAYTQAQDMVESCLNQGKGEECIEKIQEINPAIETDENGEIRFKRKINGKLKEINFSFSK